jgi:aminoglycoside phosphotransferase (APT) family kinase protein
VTTFRPGTVYADDLKRLRDGNKVTDRDRARVGALAEYLAGIHGQGYEDPSWPEGRQALWQRRLRDLIGHGEGIMGLTDSYPLPLPYVDGERLRILEELANRWRWQLKPLNHRLCQVHGDFHPFNILFHGDDGQPVVLDRSRGQWGEAADDVSCLTINYLFFSLQRADGLVPPFATLHERFWQRYLALRPDEELLAVIQPWFAWRALVLASPIWYPGLSVASRRRLLTFARRVLESERYEWDDVNRYLR